MARAGHADACEQLPLGAGDGRLAVVTLRNPDAGFFPAPIRMLNFSEGAPRLFATVVRVG